MNFFPSRLSWRNCVRALAVAAPCALLALVAHNGNAAVPATHGFAAQHLAALPAHALHLPARAGSVVDMLDAIEATREAPVQAAPMAVPVPPVRPVRAAAVRTAPEIHAPRPVDYGVFASIAVPFGGLPMQPVFRERLPRNAAMARASLESWQAWRRIEKGAGKKLEPALLGYVNREVNLAVAYRSDKAAHGTPDHWATPREIAARGIGDCEDFALAKMWVLAALGVPPERMQLVVLEDKRRGLYHAVLAVHLDDGAYILDNVTSRLKRDVAVRGYHPLYSFAADGAYIHGFKTPRAAAPAAKPAFGAIYPGLGAD